VDANRSALPEVGKTAPTVSSSTSAQNLLLEWHFLQQILRTRVTGRVGRAGVGSGLLTGDEGGRI